MMGSITQAKLHNRIRKCFIAIAWILLWQLTSMKISNDIFLPGPWSVVIALHGMVRDVNFWISVGRSFLRISSGFLIGFSFAVITGSIACRYRLVREFLAPMITIVKSIPVASFIILILVWVSSKQLAVFISFLVTFPIIFIAVLEGYDNVNQELVEMARVYHVKPWMQIRYLYTSEILPFITSSAKVAAGMCWKAGISGEIIGLPKDSIGEQLYLSKLYLNISGLFAWTIVIILVCFLFEKIFFFLLHGLEKRLLS